MQSEMQTEAGRRNPASVKARFSARSFFQWAYATLACSARQLGLCACFFLLPFVRWFGIPSPFAAALLLGLNRPPEVFSLLGLVLSLALRLLWGVESDPWQYAGLFFLWLLLRRSRPRPGIETAALGGAAMMPRAIQSLFTGEPLTMLLSLAAVPVCMAISAWFRDGLDRTGFAPPRFRDKAVRIFLGLLLISGLGYFQLFGVSLGQAGAVLGYIGAMEYLIRRAKTEMGGKSIKVVATGGLARMVADNTDLIDIVDPQLVLDGLRIIYEREKKS